MGSFKRLILFLLVFAGVIAGIYLLVFGSSYSAIKTLRENRESLAEGSEYIIHTQSLKGLTVFVGGHPEHVSIASFSVSHPDSGIFYEADEPRTLGTLTNLLLLIEYERQVAQGLLNTDKKVDLKHIERYTLPQISQNYHKSFLSELSSQPTLDELVAAIIEHNDLAAADYLWFLLGEDNLQRLVTELKLPESALPLPFSGMYMNINALLSDTAQFANCTASAFAEAAIGHAQRLNSDTEFAAEIKKLFKKHRLSLTFMQERDALACFPKASAKELAELTAKLVKGEIFGDEVSEKVLQKMRWPTKSTAATSNLSDYGALYDDRMGLLGGIDFGVPREGGLTRVQAVIFDRLPVALWVHMSANHMNRDFQQRLIWDPQLFEITVNETAPAHE